MLNQGAERAGRIWLRKFSWVFLVIGNMIIAVAIAMLVAHAQIVPVPVPEAPGPSMPSPSPSSLEET